MSDADAVFKSDDWAGEIDPVGGEPGADLGEQLAAFRSPMIVPLHEMPEPVALRVENVEQAPHVVFGVPMSPFGHGISVFASATRGFPNEAPTPRASVGIRSV